MKLLNVSGSPHVHSDESTKKIMWRVNLALVPSLIVAIAFFGLNALLISIVSVGSCILFQWLIEKFLLKTESTISDGSAVVTGLLLAFNVPATREMILLVIIAALVAIGIGKMSFGGLGKNPFNPALVGRVFMLISFPVQMTTWPKPGQNLFSMVSQPTTDLTTGPTPLGMFKENGVQAVGDIWGYFVGHIGGDDFIAIISNDKAELLCQNLILDFDYNVLDYFTEEHIKMGYMETENRTGIIEQFPLTSISIGVVEIDENSSITELEIGEIGAQVKHAAKAIQGSSYAINKRKI